MTDAEKINLEIDKQINAGFTAPEIKQNLLTLNFTETAIEEAFKKRPMNAAQSTKKSTTGSSVVSLLISVFFIVNGSMRISSSLSGSVLYNWGIVLVCVGCAGVIWKTVYLVRK